MAYQAIYTGTIFTRTGKLTVDVEQNDLILPVPALSTVVFERSLVWNYGSVTGGSFERGKMPGHATLRLLDPNRTVFDHLSLARTNGAQDTDFRVHISNDSATVDLYGLIRIKNIASTEAVWTQVPVLSLQVYDGLGETDRLQRTTIAGFTDINTTFRSGLNLQQLLLQSALPIADIDYRLDFFAANTPAGQNFINVIIPYMDDVLFTERRFEDALSFLATLLGARIWQGLDGRWHVEQIHLTGREGTVVRDEISGVVVAAIGETIAQIERRHISARNAFLTRTMADPIVAVEATREVSDTPISAPFNYYRATLLRAGAFDTASNFFTPNWPVSELSLASNGLSGSIDSRGQTGQCLLLEEDEGNEQALPWVSVGERFFVTIRIFYALENVSTSGSQSAFIRLRFEPFNPADVVHYVDADGEYTETDTTILSTAQSLDANGADPLTWYEWQITLQQAAPATGRLVVELLGCGLGSPPGSGYNTLFDDVAIYPASPGADDGSGFAAPESSARYRAKLEAFDEATGVALKGQSLRMDLPVPHTSSHLSTLDFLSTERHNYFFRDTSQSPNDFSVSAFVYDGEPYTDPLEMLFYYMRDVGGSYRWVLEGLIDGLYPPERPVRDLDGVVFTMLSGSLDLVEETTRLKSVENALAPVEPPGVLPEQVWIVMHGEVDTPTEAGDVNGLCAFRVDDPWGTWFMLWPEAVTTTASARNHLGRSEIHEDSLGRAWVYYGTSDIDGDGMNEVRRVRLRGGESDERVHKSSVTGAGDFGTHVSLWYDPAAEQNLILWHPSVQVRKIYEDGTGDVQLQVSAGTLTDLVHARDGTGYFYPLGGLHRRLLSNGTQDYLLFGPSPGPAHSPIPMTMTGDNEGTRLYAMAIDPSLSTLFRTYDIITVSGINQIIQNHVERNSGSAINPNAFAYDPEREYFYVHSEDEGGNRGIYRFRFEAHINKTLIWEKGDTETHHLFLKRTREQIYPKENNVQTVFRLETGGTVSSAGAGMQAESTIVTGLSSLSRALDFDQVGLKLYIADNLTIRQCNPNGSNLIAWHTEASQITGLAIDALNSHVYFALTDTIKRADLGGATAQNVTTVVSTSGGVRHISLDPELGHLYWANFTDGEINRSALSGASETLVATIASAMTVLVEPGSAGTYFYFAASGDSVVYKRRKNLTQDAEDAYDTADMGVSSTFDQMAIDPDGMHIYLAQDTAVCRFFHSLSGLAGGDGNACGFTPLADYAATARGVALRLS